MLPVSMSLIGPSTNGMESFWSVLKRGYHGKVVEISHWHRNRYVYEFCGRHNIRGLDTVEMMLSMVAGMVGNRLTYMDTDRQVTLQADLAPREITVTPYQAKVE